MYAVSKPPVQVQIVSKTRYGMYGSFTRDAMVIVLVLEERRE